MIRKWDGEKGGPERQSLRLGQAITNESRFDLRKTFGWSVVAVKLECAPEEVDQRIGALSWS